MLHVSIHAGALAEISRFNRLDWVDIGYQDLKREADYKIVLFNVGDGATEPVILKKYPRWSTTLWDLVARAIALASSPDPKHPQEAMPALEEVPKRFAYAECLSAVIQHRPPNGVADRRLGSMEIVRFKKGRGVYRATIEEDLRPSMSAMPFVFRPKFLRPCELVARAAVMAMTGSIETLPPWPALLLPNAYPVAGEPHVIIHKIKEPARTGFLRWLHRSKLPVVPLEGARDGAAPERVFTRFMAEAI